MLDQARKLQLRLIGDRFGNGQIPLEFLRDLAALGEALREAAKESYPLNLNVNIDSEAISQMLSLP